MADLDSQPNPYSSQTPSPFGAPVADYGGGGNPANRGFTSGAPSISTGSGALIDTILNMLVSGLMGKLGSSGMPSMGRPQVSDYSRRMMMDREEESSRLMSGVYGKSPSSKLFGPLGDNAIAQQAGDMFFQSGGSRAEAFKQVYGRFGSQFGGPGPGGIKKAGEDAAQVISNMDDQFTNRDTGNWNYSKTAGFNRQNTISAVAEFSDAFGGKGKEAIKTMSKPGGDKESKKALEAAGKDIQEITETVREAGNFFGPNMPYSQLMKELKNMTDGAKSMSTVDLKNALQDVQGMAVAVDMSNEAFANYMKVIGEINKNSGGTMNTTSLAVQSMAAGKAMEDSAKAKLKDGEVYTGPSKEEGGMNIARISTDRNSSLNAQAANAIYKTLDDSDSPLAQEAGEALRSGDYEKVQKLYNKGIAEGTITSDQRVQAEKTISAYQSDPSKLKQASWQINKSLDERNIEDKTTDIVNNAQKVLGEALSPFLDNDENSDIIKKAGGKDVLKKELSEGKYFKNRNEMEDVKSVKQKLRAAHPELSDEEAGRIANGSAKALSDEFKDQEQLNTHLGVNDEAFKENYKQTIQRGKDEKAAISKGAAGSYELNSDAGWVERGANTARGIYSDMKELSKKNGGKVEFSEFLKIAKSRGATEILGVGDAKMQESNAKRYYERQQVTDEFVAERDRLLKKKGIDPAKATDAQKKEVEEPARKVARDKIFGKDSINGQDFKIEEEERARLRKDAVDNKKFTKESDIEADVEKNMQKFREKRAKEQGLTTEDGKKEQEKEKNKEEDAKDETTTRLIAAIEANTAALNPLAGIMKTLGEAFMNFTLPGLIMKAVGLGGSDKVANGD